VHYAVFVQMEQSAQQTMHELLYLDWSEETIGLLDFMEELAARQQLKDYVD